MFDKVTKILSLCLFLILFGCARTPVALDVDEINSSIVTDREALSVETSLQNIDLHTAIAIAVKNYGVSQGDEHFLILQKDIRTSLYFYVDDLTPIINRLSFSLPLMDPDKRSAAQAQLGILKKARN